MKLLKIGITLVLGLMLMGFVFNQSLVNQFLTKVAYIVPKENASIIVSIDAEVEFTPKKRVEIKMDEDIIVETVFSEVGEIVNSSKPLFKMAKLNQESQENSVVDHNAYFIPQDEGILLEMPAEGDTFYDGDKIAKMTIGTSYSDMSLELKVATENADFLNVNEHYIFVSEQISELEGFEDGISFITHKRRYVSENGLVRFTCNFSNELGSPTLKQVWRGRVEKTIKTEGTSVPKRVVLTEDGRYMPNKTGRVFVIGTRNGILGDESFIETIDVKILKAGDYEVVIEGLEKDLTGSWPRIVMNISQGLKSGMRVFVIE